LHQASQKIGKINEAYFQERAFQTSVLLTVTGLQFHTIQTGIRTKVNDQTARVKQLWI